jgi:hypothetical protein
MAHDFLQCVHYVAPLGGIGLDEPSYGKVELPGDAKAVIEPAEYILFYG